jgi:predicted anti-sigma-YlaC factor YlaD
MQSYESTTQVLSRPDQITCAMVQDLLPLYIEQEVSERSQMTISEHIAQCAHCAGYLEGTRNTRTQLQQAQQQRTQAVQQERILYIQQFAQNPWSSLLLTALLCGMGGGSMLISFERFTADRLFLLLPALGAYIGLLALAQQNRTLNLLSGMHIGLASIVGVLGLVMLVQSSSLPISFFGFLLLLAAFSAIYMTIIGSTWPTR